ncbi:hypothetical protein F3Y22_tig00110940pilonHSYRG00252 [Hibiscus syriacus]|uniref:AP2/ERF domain-containing protein n=1 Tax=Hibiscus syriacus TaxID=106335 RepID=A0A6A2ZCR2_HIBSY|nr:hypothetical protein F3Y22_tig00110940pilonHSYRG00252 [Hibiscus syriacus]
MAWDEIVKATTSGGAEEGRDLWGSGKGHQEAAMAYDEAACLLRGPNTKTNFSPSSNLNPALLQRSPILFSRDLNQQFTSSFARSEPINQRPFQQSVDE